MALKAVVQNLEQVPEADRGYYVQRDGMFVADVEPVEASGKRWALEEVGGLKSALQNERTAREALSKERADLEAKTREAIERAEELSKIDPASEAAKLAEAQVKSLTEQFETKHKTELGKRDERIKNREDQLAKVLKSDAIRRELIDAGAVTEDLDYLEFHAAKMVDMDERDGELVPIVTDGKNRLVSMQSGSTDYMSIGELVRDYIRPKHLRHFVGENASGSGSNQHSSANNNGGGATTLRIPRGDQAAINANLKRIADGSAVVV